MSHVAAILHPAVDRGEKTAPLKSAIGQDTVHTPSIPDSNSFRRKPDPGAMIELAPNGRTVVDG